MFLYLTVDRTNASVKLLSSFNITGNPATPTLVNTNMFLSHIIVPQKIQLCPLRPLLFPLHYAVESNRNEHLL